MWKKTIDLDSPTLTSHQLRLIFGETGVELAKGTGFIYEHKEVYYLITNGHNVTGINPETNERLANHSGFPTIIVTRCLNNIKADNVTLIPEVFKIDLYEDESYSRPKWLIHPKFGYNVDVIAIPIIEKKNQPEHVNLFPINALEFDEVFEPRVSDDVFVLGFPFGSKSKLEMPIWKKGSIATEISINIDNLPKLLIDTATRSGMSGSPVIYQRNGAHVHPSGDMGKNVLGLIRGFLGVYSGRIGNSDNFKAQLGIVWRQEVIKEILDGSVKGTVEFQTA